ncbi:hypothetical protein RESH_01327 [Rhodopirellula europaea SH398]|uniref:Uncharacterized protein n=1 Tax=Rhodopirellula europaea SH398 TaxID=1263868 RepID=M5S9E1_9BACT|nr:hypothetical protein RESH_01327 [Rhodopirellula europaea SH398]
MAVSVQHCSAIVERSDPLDNSKTKKGTCGKFSHVPFSMIHFIVWNWPCWLIRNGVLINRDPRWR